VITAGKIAQNAVEISWISGFMYTQGRRFNILGSDRVTFRKPAKVGDILQFDSEIVFQNQDIFRVFSKVSTLEGIGKPQNIISTFNFTFQMP
jgi:acyl-CoA hydrolase